jgi:hypothetical protein
MRDPENLAHLEKRAFRYDVQDGFTEFLAGILFFFVARAAIDPHLAWVPALLVFPMRWASRFFKEKFTYPRVGYVKLKTEDGKKMGRGMFGYLAAVIGILAAILLATGGLTSGAAWRQWLPALAGGFTSGGFFYLAGRSGMWRHRLLGVFVIVWGVACSLLFPADFGTAFSRWALGTGLVSLLLGLVVFLVFVRNHPVREAEVADERG